MKIITENAAVGRFVVGSRVKNSIALIGEFVSFDTYDDAEAQLKKYVPQSLQHEFYILQVVGQFMLRPHYVEVHPA